jgi:hypothetical protein
MRAIRKADPTFTHYVPRTAVEAVDRYVRCRKNGLRAMMVPECLIECAAGLPPAELDLFEDWIINPNGSLDHASLCPDRIAPENETLYKQTLKRLGETPPLPMPTVKELQTKALVALKLE